MIPRAALLREIAAGFAAAGLEAPEREARALLRAGLGLTDLDLVARADMALPAEDAARLRALASRRAAGEPLARLVGRREFWSLDFALSPETLVPRPETETLVEAALALFPERHAALRILDLGTGSGALLAALLGEYPAAVGIGVDLSHGAARQARQNLAALGFGARAAVVVGHWAEALGGGFDLVVSNPPYIPSTDIAALDREVRHHDPHLALDGGPQGLDAYRALAHALPGLLAPGGRAVLELGIGQEDDVAALLAAAGLPADGAARRDLAGIARAIVTRPARV
ncbi:peptide chain release factor N(5)-glutamine methyltransferase [Ancylobacter dichloromethanicus]|uniref:Release factor glutamine methyltransferase n=1 Tax=Ancylobacter dichloromethanicus TaxID=518825 RepID=A0A9W6J7N6_9HYPH|nr:peptide chain release factor N(5)-glutamine methyltransferase [Ancylobacter dichloromethanicus]MBS7555606.1 peptide chain release factor N(5)-glutamine methyltransferase [Ancylobacter dichloromethanicus]GLK70808.1 release factor glutamine methyltransferase [Ancylobacter dichloromethanicus]